MGRWISKAANVFKRDAPEAVQPFEVDCQCGQRHQGVRRKSHQHIICTSCGASTFILPRDVYPPPLEPARSPAKRPKTVVDEQNPDIDLGESDPDDPFQSKSVFRPESKSGLTLPAPRPTKRQKRKRKREQEEQKAEDSRKKSRKSQGPSVLQQTGKRVAESANAGWSGFRSFWTPFRTVFLALLVVAAVTAGLGIRQWMLSRAVEIARTKAESGMLAVRDENWAEARRDLGEATDALNLLGRTDPEAEEIRQYYRESLSLTRLSPTTLFELLERANTSWDGEEDRHKWTTSFSTRFRGEWFVFSGDFRLTPIGEDDDTVWTLSLPWAPGIEGPILLQIDCRDLEELPPGEAGTPAVVAAPLDSVLPPAGDHGWILVFDPEESFLWANFPTYRHLGFEFDAVRSEDALKAQLRQQSAVIGLAPPKSLAANLDGAESADSEEQP